MLDRTGTYAIVGANNNEEKYGHKVFKDLLDAGYKVIPINPNEKEVLGQKAYTTLSDYPGLITMVIFVVPPHVTEHIVEEVKKLGIKKVWMQPGSESPQAIIYCQENSIECIHDACIMIQKNIQ